MTSAIEQEVLHEIAMSIGNSLDMQKMLKESLSVFTRRLGCSASTLLYRQADSETFEPLITVPLRAAENSQLNSAQRQAIEFVNLHEPFPRPLTIDSSGFLHYGWSVGKNGILIVGRSSPLSKSLINEIDPLMDKLSIAITACHQFHELNLAQNALAQERTLLNNLVANLTAGVLLEDDEGNVLHINQRFINLFGLQDNFPSIYNENQLQLNVISSLFEFPEDFHAQTINDMKSHSVSLNREFTLINSHIYLRDYTPIELNDGKLAHLWQYRDITNRKLVEQRLMESQLRLEHLAHHDALTNLPNRIQLEPLLKSAMQRADRSESLVAVCFLDLDNFKQVNDQHGHHIGDKLLIEVGKALCESVRATDSVARLGGDEFVVILCDLENFDHLDATLKRIHAAVSRDFAIDSLTLSVTASVGVTIYPLDRGDTDTLIRHADQAMYKVKQGGRGDYHLFDIHRDLEIGKHQREINRLWQALDNEEFTLYFQPKVNMRSGDVIGAEALIRWNDPENGLIPPGDFLPLVDSDNKLNKAVGNWVIFNALRKMQEWSQQGIDLSISVNISAIQLQSEGFTLDLVTMLDEFPKELSHRLELEILETASIENPQGMRQILDECEKLGLKSSLDDFGTGYSSLAYLKQLPIHTIKIDQSFVRDLMSDPDDYAIVDGVIRLASAFKKEIIAEGVETAEQGVMLMLLGCNNAQGYYISRPMPAEEFTEWVHSYQIPDAWREFDR